MSAKKRCGGRKCVKPKVPQCKKGPDGKKVSIDGKHKCWEPCKEGKCPKGTKKAGHFNPGQILARLNKNNVKKGGLPLTNLAVVEDTSNFLELQEELETSLAEIDHGHAPVEVEDGEVVLLEVASGQENTCSCIFENV